MTNDPREIIRQTPMSAAQWIAVVLMIALNALDGFDGDVFIACGFDGGQSVCEIHQRADAHQRDHRGLGDGVRGGSVRAAESKLGFCDL